MRVQAIATDKFMLMKDISNLFSADNKLSVSADSDTTICEAVPAQMEEKKVVSIENVRKVFGKGASTKHALKGVSFDL